MNPLAIHTLFRRAASVFMLILALSVRPSFAQDSLSLRFVHAVALNHHIADLSWNSIPNARQYTLYRHFPNQSGFDAVATLPDTHFVDTLHRVICADTVRYFVRLSDTSAVLSTDTVGIFFQDDVPTAPCSLRLCSVDTALGQIRLSWYPSPDTDVMGYYICIGSPCRDFDTVWGRLNTSYLCPPEFTASENSFRILAFDSCYQASPLTPYYHNPLLSLSAAPCSRQLRFDWNRYINMPDSVSSYRLHYRLLPDTHWHTHVFPPAGPFSLDTLVANLATGGVTAYLSVHNATDTLRALSALATLHFDYGDTAAYARILTADFDPTLPAVQLSFDIDPSFPGPFCTLLRAKGNDPSFTPLATLPLPVSSYTDMDIHRSAGRYIYRLDVPDLCQQRVVSSDTVSVVLPETEPPAAYFPNIIRYGDPECGRFCPQYVSALAADYHLEIYTRWGERIFHTKNLSDCWDGTNVSGQPLPQGVYLYYVHCRHADGVSKYYRGTITLIH